MLWRLEETRQFQLVITAEKTRVGAVRVVSRKSRTEKRLTGPLLPVAAVGLFSFFSTTAVDDWKRSISKTLFRLHFQVRPRQHQADGRFLSRAKKQNEQQHKNDPGPAINIYRTKRDLFIYFHFIFFSFFLVSKSMNRPIWPTCSPWWQGEPLNRRATCPTSSCAIFHLFLASRCIPPNYQRKDSGNQAQDKKVDGKGRGEHTERTDNINHISSWVCVGRPCCSRVGQLVSYPMTTTFLFYFSL